MRVIDYQGKTYATHEKAAAKLRRLAASNAISSRSSGFIATKVRPAENPERPPVVSFFPVVVLADEDTYQAHFLASRGFYVTN